MAVQAACMQLVCFKLLATTGVSVLLRDRLFGTQQAASTFPAWKCRTFRGSKLQRATSQAVRATSLAVRAASQAVRKTARTENTGRRTPCVREEQLSPQTTAV